MRWILRIVVALLIVAGAAYAVLHQLRAVAVVEPVKRGPAVDAPSGTIRVVARMSPVQAEVEGRILSSELELGAEVKAGDLLVEIDSSAVRLQIERLTSDLATAKRRLEIGTPSIQALEAARQALRIAEADFTRGSIASNDLEAVRRTERSAAQTADLEVVKLTQDIAIFENELKLAEYRLERMKIFSGIDGTVVAVEAGVTDRVSPGTVLARISSRNREVEMQVGEEQVARLTPGLKARVQFQAFSLERFDGVIEQILPPLDVNSQRYRVFLKVDIPPERLLHGMTGEAFIEIDRRENALIISRSALVDGTVYVVRDGRVVRQDVQMGYTSIHEAEVLSGLQEGDLVVVENVDQMREGRRVKVVAKSPSA